MNVDRLRLYDVGSPTAPGLLIMDEQLMATVVSETVQAGRRVTIRRRSHTGELVVWREMDGLVAIYRSDNGRDRKLLAWPIWAHRVRRLLSETSETNKEGA